MAHEGKNKKGSHFFDLSSQPHFIHDMVFSFIRQLTTRYNINIWHTKNMKKIVTEFSVVAFNLTNKCYFLLIYFCYYAAFDQLHFSKT